MNVVQIQAISWRAHVLQENSPFKSALAAFPGVTGVSPSSIFAVIAGILLIRGGLRTARVVASFSALMLSSFIGLMLFSPLMMPFDLVLTELRIHPSSCISYLIFPVCVLVLLIWVYSRLTAPLITAAIAEKHPRWTTSSRRPRNGFFVGALLVIVVVVLFGLMLHSPNAERARVQARLKVGDGYKFFVSSLNMQSSNGHTHVAAVVTAYNQNEIKKIHVEWDE